MVRRRWESEAATDGEVRAMEVKLIRETAANHADIGYNLWPRWSSTSSTCHFHRVNVFVTIGWATQYADIADQNDCGVAARVGVDRHAAPGDHQMA